MKHILPILTAALALMTTAVFAEAKPFTYNGFSVTPKDYDNSDFQGEGKGCFYVVEFTANSKLYLINHINTLFGDKTTEALTTMGITDFGYYKNGGTALENSYSLIEGNSNYVAPTTFTFSLDPSKANIDSISRTGYLLGEFNAGDKVEIWMTDGITSVSSNTLIPSETGEGGVYSGRFDGRADLVTTYSSDGTVIPVAQLFLANSPSGAEVNFGLYAIGTGEGSDNGGTFGAPLPGGLQIALIAGLFGLGFWYIRRKKSIAC